MLCRGEREEKAKAVFELRAACLAGYLPDLGGCSGCGADDGDRFDLSAGQLLCSRCRSSAAIGIRLPVSADTLEAMRYITQCDAKRLFGFELGQENLIQLSQVTESYLCTQLERGFSALDFYKSLLI